MRRKDSFQQLKSYSSFQSKVCAQSPRKNHSEMNEYKFITILFSVNLFLFENERNDHFSIQLNVILSTHLNEDILENEHFFYFEIVSSTLSINWSILFAHSNNNNNGLFHRFADDTWTFQGGSWPPLCVNMSWIISSLPITIRLKVVETMLLTVGL